MTVVMQGWGIGFVEMSLFFLFSFLGKRFISTLRSMSCITYYWICMTMLIGLWETSYLIHYREIDNMSIELRINNTHIWVEKYSTSYILPWNFAKIIYSEYLAWADRDYSYINMDWSNIMERTPAIFTAMFAFIGLFARVCNSVMKSYVFISIAMGIELMNTIIYTTQYGINCNNEHNSNYNSYYFPLGVALSNRPLMYVNTFFILMPIVILIKIICFDINMREWKKCSENCENTGADYPPDYNTLDDRENETLYNTNSEGINLTTYTHSYNTRSKTRMLQNDTSNI